MKRLRPILILLSEKGNLLASVWRLLVGVVLKAPRQMRRASFLWFQWVSSTACEPHYKGSSRSRSWVLAENGREKGGMSVGSQSVLERVLRRFRVLLHFVLMLVMCGR